LLERERLKVNAVEIDINNSIEHELGKFICVWLIRKGVPRDLLPEYFKNAKIGGYDVQDIAIGLAEGDGQKFNRKWQVPQVVTEARFKVKSTWLQRRRADIFILDTGEIVEIETNKKIKKKGAITVYV